MTASLAANDSVYFFSFLLYTYLMSFSERPHPPSDKRVFAAASAGYFARSPSWVAGAVLVCSGALVYFGSTGFVQSTGALFKKYIGFSSAYNTAPGAALGDILGPLWLLLITVLCAGSITSLFFVLWARRKKGVTAVEISGPLPDMGDRLVVGTLCSMVLVPLICVLVLRSGLTFEQFAGDPMTAVAATGHLAGKVLFSSGLVLCLGGIIQVSLYKQRLLRMLSLDAGDAKKEQKLNEGNAKRFRFGQWFS